MLTFFDWSFWFNFVYFFAAVFIAFFVPGNVLLSKIKLSRFQVFVLSTITGVVLWAWQAFFFGYLNLRSFTYIYLLLFFIIWIKQNKNKIQFPRLYIKKVDKILFAIILFGVIFQLSSVYFAGVLTTKGLFFCCGNTLDNILHIAISNQVVENFPPHEPGYYGLIKSNYHYWSSIVVGELVRVFKLPLIATGFQYTSILISLFLGLSALVFAQLIGIGKVFTRWLVFLLYFGSDLVWLLVALLRGQEIFVMKGLETGQQFLENLPRAFAVVVFLLGLSLFVLLLKRKSLILAALVALVFSSTIGFKVYLGLFLLPGIFVLFFYFLWKRNIIMVATMLLTLVLMLAAYLPVNSKAGGLYFVGLWRFENFAIQPYLGELNRLELARIIFLQHGNWIRVFLYEIIFAILYFIAIFGIKLIAFIQSRKSLSLIPFEINVLLLLGITSSLLVGIFFFQRSGAANTFNFLVSVFIIVSIYTALTLYHFLRGKKRWFVILITILVVSINLPRTVDSVYNNIVKIRTLDNKMIGNDELEALNFLKKTTASSLVLVDPAITLDRESPYVGFMTNKKMFLSGQENNLRAHNIDFSVRLKSLNKILTSKDPEIRKQELEENNIGYIFLLKITFLKNTVGKDLSNFTEMVFENKDFVILKVI
jgi:hypothetical protein